MKPKLTPVLLLLSALMIWIPTLSAQGYRTIDGYNNNLIFKNRGMAGEPQVHFGTVGYADGISAPAGPDRPNARMVSNKLFAQNTLANTPMGLSAYCWAWGQFIDHDITLVADNPAEPLMIPVPMGDPWFDPANTGSQVIPMMRSEADPATGTGPANPRRVINGITAFIDGSTIYGSDEDRAAWLRSFSGGTLRMSAGNLLPWNTTTGEQDGPVDPDAPGMAMPLPGVTKWFVSGDVRANENPFLTAMHTLFAREHNRLCGELALQHPGWSDEDLYQHARRLVIGQIASIVYNEWLPAMGMEIPAYDLYDPFTDPQILNEFSAAAYRYGHTTINSLLVRMDNDGNYLPQGDILLRDAFFNSAAITQVGGIDPYLIGMATVVQQDFDCKVVDDLRHFLFGKPGQGGMDLAAINIQRGRERGLPDYNTLRTDFGLAPLTGFDDLSADPLMNLAMADAYGQLDRIDPWVGMLAEDHMPDALFGKTAMTIVREQFLRLRDGDRYFFENDLEISDEEKSWLRTTRLADVVRRNTPVTIVQDDLFFAHPLVSAVAPVGPGAVDFALYPNPAREKVVLRIFSADRADARVAIADGSGRILLERPMALGQGNNTLTLSLPFDWPEGLYHLSVTAGNRMGTKSFVRVE